MKKKTHKVFSFLTSSVLRPTSVALLVSRLLDPMWVITTIVLLGAYKSGLTGEALLQFILVIILFMLLPPLILRFRLTKTKGSNGWDIANRADRPRALVVLLLLGTVNIVVARTWGNVFLGNLFIFFEFWMVGYLIISLFYKISGHAGSVALFSALVILWFGWNWWPLLALIPLVGWSRVVTKNHTIFQIIAGTIYSWAVLGMAISLL